MLKITTEDLVFQYFSVTGKPVVLKMFDRVRPEAERGVISSVIFVVHIFFNIVTDRTNKYADLNSPQSWC